MEKLTINIPENKSTLVKQILKGLGVIIEEENHTKTSEYKDRLTQVSNWTDDDLKVFEESKKAFESLKPEQW
jgi:hypothetical protein